LSPDAYIPYPGEPGLTEPWAAGWNTIENFERYEDDADPDDPDDFYGFGQIELTLGHGSQVAGHHYRWALDRGATRDQLVAGFRHDSDVPRRSPLWWQIHDAPFPEELYSTNFVTERTIGFIEASHAAGEPWMAWCSYPDPHHPLSPPARWLDRHDPAEVELPITFDDPGEGWPLHLQLIRAVGPNDENFVIPFGPTPEQARAAIAATYGMIEFIDDGIGRVLAGIDRLGVTDNTIVVFTSDHGDMMGDHGLIMKLAMHFQGCLRVPMVIHAPGKAAGRTSSLASSIDLPNTLLDLCGIDEYRGMQGHGLTDLLDDPTASVRDHVLVEEDFPMRAFGPGPPLKMRTVISDLGRYTRDTDGQEQLFDLTADPDELVDLTVRDRTRRATMVDRLADALIEADDLCRPEPAGH
jgi:arylsulfatase A-like enzyme